MENKRLDDKPIPKRHFAKTLTKQRTYMVKLIRVNSKQVKLIKRREIESGEVQGVLGCAFLRIRVYSPSVEGGVGEWRETG